jgi:hypothetical protein
MGKYVVYLVTYSGDKLPKYYIGSTSIEKINNGYLGSVKSKKWKTIFELEIKNNKELFNSEILSYHETRQDALSEELRIQKEQNVVKSNEYINESLASKNGFFGMAITDEHKIMLSKIAKETHEKGKLHKLTPMCGKNNPMYGKTNEVVAINVLTNKKVRVSKKVFDSDINLSGHTIGFVSVIEIETGKKITITKEEFKRGKNNYKHHNKDKKHSDELKNKLSEMRIGYITAKDWEGKFHRIHKDDIRLKNGEFGNTTSKRWVITDLDGNEYKTFNFRAFFNDNCLQYPRKENIIDGVIKFKIKSKNKSTNGWKVKCLDK